MQPRFEIADAMVREMQKDLENLGLPTNLHVRQYFCNSCGGVVVIGNANFSGETEFPCQQCGANQRLQTCYLREVRETPAAQAASASYEPQLSADENR